MSQNANQLQIRVYYEDTDAGGIVFYANYLKFFERARTEWLRRLGIHQSTMAQTEQQLFVVKQADIEYLKSAKLDDLLTIRSRITHLGGASIRFAQEAWREDDLLCQSQIVVVCVDSHTMRATKINPHLRSILEKAQD
ncbi:MAG: tol-pal system-associated acyl-CoA thioesterase [Alcaligenaceae bacterium]|nr:tol-pal system-associated acyl-CoA thioesterase [Paenalcaligenes sp.]NLJ62644.1 tol-pal system-associated acyl-CoA thioesterase [Alcaligenaceae bacterium]